METRFPYSMFSKEMKFALRWLASGCWLTGIGLAQSPVTITVTKSPGTAIAPDFVGLSFGPSALAQGVFTPTNAQMLTIFQNLGIKYFRMGGTEVDTTTDAEDTAYADSFFQFIQSAGITDVIYSLKLENGDPVQDASVAGYIWTNYQSSLTCFALGNEPNLNSDNDPAITNFSSYFTKWQSFAGAISSVVPLAKFGGPDDAGNSTWDNDFANAERGSPNVVEIQSHWYVGGSSSGMTAAAMISQMLSPSMDTNSYPSHYNNYEAVAASDGFPFRLTEFDSFSGGNVSGGSDGFASALFALDAMHWWAQQGCAGLSVHTGLSNLNGAVWQDANGNWQLFPWAYAIKAFNLGNQGNAESLTLVNTNSLNLTAYATGTLTNLFVTIVNKENDTNPRDASVTLIVNGFSSASVSAMYLLAPNGNLQATNGITLGGAYITNNAIWAGQWTPLNPLTNGQGLLTVAAGSAAIVKIAPLGPDESVLQAQTSGLGTISPDYNDVALTNGQSYSMTATPASGFIFTNWTGGINAPLAVLTNGTTLQFLMQASLTLQANFLDTIKPTLAITSPMPGQQVNSSVFIIAGVAADNWQVSNVWYQLDGQGWNSAATTNGWTNWTATVALLPGLNSLLAYAVDPGGNISATDSLSFQCVPNVSSLAFFQTITNLNPVGYWPMHEVEPMAPGDLETNYGSLGLLGAGYYSDWESGANSRILHGIPGAIAGDADTAVYFAAPKQNVTTTTNSLNVPRVSPLSALNPPFSVECWFEATNSLGTNGQGDILGESAYEGLNAGINGNGAGNVCGFRLYWNVNKINVFGYANSSVNNTLGTANGLTTNQWYHIVVTCDTNTIFTLYTNGVQAGSTVAGAGLYTPDYWMPFEIGNSRGNTHPINGVIDEVAVYTNALSFLDISNHYAAGINPGASPDYFALVTNDNPTIYLRMDSPMYAAPAPNTWPILTNYGSVGVNGVYTPGTIPGALSGPETAGGAPFAGLLGVPVAQLSGVSSFADAGYAAAYNPVGPAPFTVMAMFRGNPCDGRTNTIVGHTGNSWSLSLTPTGRLMWLMGTNAPAVTSAGVYNDGNWHQAVAVYAPAGNPNVAGTNSLYVDGALDTSVAGVGTNGFAPGSSLDVMIGADPQYTNNPNGLGQQFAGQICEVALFTNALAAAQIQSLYNTAVFSSVNTTPTNLVLSVTNNQLYLSWPADHIGWVLQAETNNLFAGIGTNWVSVANSQNTNDVIVPINLSNGCVFYRLVYP